MSDRAAELLAELVAAWEPEDGLRFVTAIHKARAYLSEQPNRAATPSSLASGPSQEGADGSAATINDAGQTGLNRDNAQASSSKEGTCGPASPIQPAAQPVAWWLIETGEPRVFWSACRSDQEIPGQEFSQSAFDAIRFRNKADADAVIALHGQVDHWLSVEHLWTETPLYAAPAVQPIPREMNDDMLAAMSLAVVASATKSDAEILRAGWRAAYDAFTKSAEP